MLMLVVAVPLGWLSSIVIHARKQRAAVAALKEIGCSIEYEDVSKSPITEWMGSLLGQDAFFAP